MSTTPNLITANAVNGRLLNRREAAAYLSVSERTLFSHTAPQGNLPCVKLGNRVVYSMSDLLAFIAQNRVTKTTE